MHCITGKAKKPLAWVKQDERYPTMWRIHWPDGRISDMVNLPRACDAAVAWAERGPPGRNRRRLHWIQERSKSARVGATAILRARGYLTSPQPNKRMGDAHGR